jgi:hypothetical protein
MALRVLLPTGNTRTFEMVPPWPGRASTYTPQSILQLDSRMALNPRVGYPIAVLLCIDKGARVWYAAREAQRWRAP